MTKSFQPSLIWGKSAGVVHLSSFYLFFTSPFCRFSFKDFFKKSRWCSSRKAVIRNYAKFIESCSLQLYLKRNSSKGVFLLIWRNLQEQLFLYNTGERLLVVLQEKIKRNSTANIYLFLISISQAVNYPCYFIT